MSLVCVQGLSTSSSDFGPGPLGRTQTWSTIIWWQATWSTRHGRNEGHMEWLDSDSTRTWSRRAFTSRWLTGEGTTIASGKKTAARAKANKSAKKSMR